MFNFLLREGTNLFSNSKKENLSLTQRNLIERPDKLRVNYALIGGFAVVLYGFKRFTVDIDLLITKDDLEKIHKKLIGPGYKKVFNGSRAIIDVETGVRIKFVVTGEHPGDGKPKPVSFPSPSDVKIKRKGVKIIN